jgi:hypothetical protein
MLMLLKISHLLPYETADNAYSWVDRIKDHPLITEVQPLWRVVNADVYKYIGQMAWLADRGFTLKRKPADDATQADKDEYNEHLAKGYLTTYDNLTKRSLQRQMAKQSRRYKKASY